MAGRWWQALAAGALLAGGAQAAEFVAMSDSGRATFEIDVAVAGWGRDTFLVDTGSSYMTLPRRAMDELQADGRAQYVKDLVGHMADGSRRVVPVYRVDTITIGGICRLDNVEAAVLPNTSRPILGLSALSGAAPFQFSVDPPGLVLHGCPQTVVTETQPPSGDALAAQ